MRLVELPFFVELGAAIERARRVDRKGSLFSALLDFWPLRSQLDKLSSGEVAKLTAAGHSIAEFRTALADFERRHFRDGDGKWRTPQEDESAEFEISDIQSKVDSLSTVLTADLRVTATFTVTKAGIFDVNQLVTNARDAVEFNSQKKFDCETLSEIDAAGRCLAFNLPTASAFHAMRSLERVIKLYLERFFVADEVRRMNNWGHYISALEKRYADSEDPKPSAEAIALLKQIKDIYRNPVIHADRTLDPAEAFTLFHSTLAAIQRIGIELPEQPEIPGLLKPMLEGRAVGAASLLAVASP